MKRFAKPILITVSVLLLAVLVGPFLIPVPPLEGVLPPEQLADPDSRFVEVNDLRIHYKEMGEGEPTFILLHGFGASTFSWREVMRPLAEHGRVIAYDRPAFGLTARPLPDEWSASSEAWGSGASPYSPEAQVDLVFGLMDALGVESAVLVGNSAGGTLAVNAALTRPDRVRALVLVDAAIYSGGSSPEWVRPLLGTPQMRRVGPLLARQLADGGDDIIRQAWHDPTLITPEIIAGYRKPLQAENWDRALWELTIASRQLNLVERLDELTMPVLVITGDDDRIVPTAESVRLAGDIPGAQLIVIPESGHVPHEEKPDEFVQTVLEFVFGDS